MIATYTATKKHKFILIFKDRQDQEVLKKVEVSGKVEARRLCKRNNILPWNF